MTSRKQHDTSRTPAVEAASPGDVRRRGGHKGKTRGAARSEWHEQLAEDRTGKTDARAPGHRPVGATSSANSVSADPFARGKALGAPVPQVTRHI